MGIIQKIQDWYQNHKIANIIVKGAAAYAALQSAESIAAETFFTQSKPAVVVKAEEQDFKISGDLTLATRILKDAPKDADKSAFQTMTRLNLDYKPEDNLHFGTRLVFETSTNPFFDHRFEKGGKELFFIDRAFINYKPDNNIELTFGAFENTFAGWMDRDIPLVGAQLKYSQNNVLSLDKLTAKLAYHIGQPWLDESNSKMLGFELSGERKLSEKVKLFLTANYMQWSGLDPELIMTNVKKGKNYKSDFDIVNAEVKLVYDTKNIPIFKGPLAFYARPMHNFGAEKDNDGITFGVGFGELKKKGDSALKIEARYIESDAAFAAYAPKYTSVTNFNQLALIGSHKLSDNSAITAILGLPQKIDGPKDRCVYMEFCYTLKF